MQPNDLTDQLKRLGDPKTTDEEGAVIAAEVAGAVFALLKRGVVALENLARSKGFQPD